MSWYRGVKEGKDGRDRSDFLDPDHAKTFLRFASEWIGSHVEKGLSKLLGRAFEKEKVATQWKNLKLLTGGGGAEIPVYAESARRSFSTLATNLAVERLQKPKDFEMLELPHSHFHRFAVAYGLSFNTVNLPNISLPNEVSPLSFEDVHAFRGRPECPTPDVG